MRIEHDIHILEDAFAHVIGFGPQQLFRDSRPNLEGARDVLALHDLFDDERGGDVDGLPRVVTLAVAGGARDNRRAAGHARHLGRLRDVVDICPEGNDRFSRAPRGNPRGGDARNPFFDGEAVVAEQIDQVAGGLEFLESKLAIAEYLIDHLLGERGSRVHRAHRLRLQCGETRGLSVCRGSETTRPYSESQNRQESDQSGLLSSEHSKSSRRNARDIIVRGAFPRVQTPTPKPARASVFRDLREHGRGT